MMTKNVLITHLGKYKKPHNFCSRLSMLCTYLERVVTIQHHHHGKSTIEPARNHPLSNDDVSHHDHWTIDVAFGDWNVHCGDCAHEQDSRYWHDVFCKHQCYRVCQFHANEVCNFVYFLHSDLHVFILACDDGGVGGSLFDCWVCHVLVILLHAQFCAIAWTKATDHRRMQSFLCVNWTQIKMDTQPLAGLLRI